jgi:ATP-binding cassette subfamily B protein
MRAFLLQRLRANWFGSELVKQNDLADCGPAALLTILRMRGGNASLEHVRLLAGATSTGTSALGLSIGARKLGIPAKVVRGNYDGLLQQAFPLIAHVATKDGRGHFVVVMDANERGVLVADPASEFRYACRADFESEWESGVALLFDAEVSEQPDSQETLRPASWVRARIKENEVLITQSAFTGLVCSLISIATALLMQTLVDKKVPSGEVAPVLWICAAMVAFGLARAALSYFRQVMVARMARELGESTALPFFDRILHAKLQYFSSRRLGDVNARLKDVLAINQTIAVTFGDMAIDATMLAMTMLVLAIKSPTSATVTSVTLLLLAAILLPLSKRIRDEQREAVAKFAESESTFMDAIRGMHEIKSFGLEGHFTDFNNAVIGGFFAMQERLRILAAKASAVAELFAVTLLAIVVFVVSYQIMREGNTLGTLVSSTALLGFATPAMLRLVQAIMSVQISWVSAARLVETISVPPDAAHGEDLDSTPGVITLEDFLIRKPDETVLVSSPEFSLQRGQMVRLRGANGSGKSTFVRALQALVGGVEGDFRVDGKPVAAIDLAQLRKEILAVNSEPHIFRGTVLENMLIHVPQDRREQAANALIETGFLSMLHKSGLREMELVGEGNRPLSTGQRQLIGIARAFAATPSFLLLDEAFNALDQELRGGVLSALRAYARDHGVLVVDHGSPFEVDAEYQIDGSGVLARTGLRAQPAALQA